MPGFRDVRPLNGVDDALDPERGYTMLTQFTPPSFTGAGSDPVASAHRCRQGSLLTRSGM